MGSLDTDGREVVTVRSTATTGNYGGTVAAVERLIDGERLIDISVVSATGVSAAVALRPVEARLLGIALTRVKDDPADATCDCPLTEVADCRRHFRCLRRNTRIHSFNGNLDPEVCATCRLPRLDPIHV